MHIEINCSLTVDELQEYQRAFPKIVKALPTVKKNWWSRLIPRLAVLLIAATVTYMVFHKNPAPVPAPAAPAPGNIFFDILPYAVVLVCVWGYFLWNLRGRFSKSAAQKSYENNSWLDARKSVTFADEGVSLQESTANAHMSWTHFIHFAVAMQHHIAPGSQRIARALGESTLHGFHGKVV